MYADGRGWVDEGKISVCVLQDYYLQLIDKGARDDGYCPVCNNKNFERWLVELEIQREAKKLQLSNLKKQQEQSIIEAQIDKSRAASAVIIYFHSVILITCKYSFTLTARYLVLVPSLTRTAISTKANFATVKGMEMVGWSMPMALCTRASGPWGGSKAKGKKTGVMVLSMLVIGWKIRCMDTEAIQCRMDIQ